MKTHYLDKFESKIDEAIDEIKKIRELKPQDDRSLAQIHTKLKSVSKMILMYEILTK